MATTRNPFESSESQIRPGGVSTRHREVERARQKVIKDGAHPQTGNFSMEYPAYGQTFEPGVSNYSAPDGSKVKVERDVSLDAYKKNPHDRKMKVNGEEFSEPAAKVYAQNKYGITVY